MKRLLSFFILFYAVSTFGMGSKGKKRPSDEAAQSHAKRVLRSATRFFSPLKSPRPDRPVEKWTTAVALSEETEVLKKIAQSIAEIPSGGYIGAEDKYFRNHIIINALIAAQKRGVKVVCHIGSGGQENKIDALKEAGIEVKEFKNLHTKRYIMSEKWIDKQAKKSQDTGRCTIYVGSHNNSYVAPNHYEDMISYHDSEVFIKAYADQQDHQDVDDTREPLKETPHKRAMTSSRLVDSNRSKADRISTLGSSSDASDMLDITSLTFNATSIVDAVQTVKRTRPTLPVRCIFDRLALTNPELLDRLQDSGAQVHIYNAQAEEKVFGKFPALQHRKTILRRLNGNTLAVVSTGNLTSNSNNEINHDSWHPMDPKMFETYRQAHDALIAECELYEDIKTRKKLNL